MSRAILLLTLLPLSSCALFGLGTPCVETCDFYVDCTIERFDDYGIECDWDDEDDVRAKCLETCEEEYKRRDGDEKKEIRDCLDCVQAELSGSCDGDDYYEAIDDECEDLCDDSTVEDFMEDFLEDFGEDVEDDLECEDYTTTYSYYSY